MLKRNSNTREGPPVVSSVLKEPMLTFLKGTLNGDLKIRRLLVAENLQKGTLNREGYLDLNLNFLETAGYV